MATITQGLSAPTTTPKSGWIKVGYGLSSLVVLMLAVDAGGKLLFPEAMIAATPPLGIPKDSSLYRIIGAILAACLALHVVSRTKVLGAILLTGFLGGAVAVNLRAGMPLFGNTLFGVYVGVMLWGGLLLRTPGLSRLLGLRATI